MENVSVTKGIFKVATVKPASLFAFQSVQVIPLKSEVLIRSPIASAIQDSVTVLNLQMDSHKWLVPATRPKDMSN